jgi:hypothetical protein
VRWDRLFEDLEDQLASEWEAERAALDSEAERLRLSRLPLGDRLRALAGDDEGGASSFELADGTVLTAGVGVVGADWVGLDDLDGGAWAALVPAGAVVAIAMPATTAIATARASAAACGAARRGLAERMTIGFVLRDLARRRSPVALHLVSGRTLTGTIDRALHDHLDIALHDSRAPRRASEVMGLRVVPYASLAWVRLEDLGAIGRTAQSR